MVPDITRTYAHRRDPGGAIARRPSPTPTCCHRAAFRRRRRD